MGLVWFCQCTSPDSFKESIDYQVRIAPVVIDGDLPPALQSYVHAYNPENLNEWLLFAGRTNQKGGYGGLHDMMGSDYAYYAFPHKSFNDTLFVYDVSSYMEYALPLGDILATVNQWLKKMGGDSPLSLSTFVYSNPLVTQVGDYLYVLGGFGPDDEAYSYPYDSLPASGEKFHYLTQNQLLRLHVPTLVQLIKQPLDAGIILDKALQDNISPIRFGYDSNNRLISTGGEMFYFDSSFYLVGGHNYQETDYMVNDSTEKTPFSQVYLNAVYAFTLDTPGLFGLVPNITQVISDLTDTDLKSTEPSIMVRNDSTSVFRRRDAPMVPGLRYATYQNTDTVAPSLSIYTGVFQYSGAVGSPVETDTLPSSNTTYPRAQTYYPLPWPDALHIYPEVTGFEEETQSYWQDQNYQQGAQSVYSAPTVVGYDAAGKLLHTFILGGIGGGLGGGGNPYLGANLKDLSDSLAAFTNGGVHITRDLSRAQQGAQSELLPQLFAGGAEGAYYGAEAIFFPIDIWPTWPDTEVLDLNALFENQNEVTLGYIYGGIEAYSPNPGGKTPNDQDSLSTGYGPTRSIATNRIWTVTLSVSTTSE